VTNPNDGVGHHHAREARAHAVEELARANVESNQTMMRLVERVKQDADMRERKIDLLERSIRQGHRLATLLAFILLFMLGLGVTNAINLNNARDNAEVTADAAKNASDTYALLLDCLNQRGQCGKQNAEANKKIIDDVKLYQLVVMYCARTNSREVDPTGDKLVGCVERMYQGGPQLKRP
jgi:hypothetical protein